MIFISHLRSSLSTSSHSPSSPPTPRKEAGKQLDKSQTLQVCFVALSEGFLHADFEPKWHAKLSQPSKLSPTFVTGGYRRLAVSRLDFKNEVSQWPTVGLRSTAGQRQRYIHSGKHLPCTRAISYNKRPSCLIDLAIGASAGTSAAKIAGHGHGRCRAHNASPSTHFGFAEIFRLHAMKILIFGE